MKKRLFALLLAALLSLLVPAALADLGMESNKGLFDFSIGIDGNFAFSSYTAKDDYSYGEIYIVCPCEKDHEADDLVTSYTITPHPDCPYTLTLDPGRRGAGTAEVDGNAHMQFIDSFFVNCDVPDKLPVRAGVYPFTITVTARCGERTDTAACTIELTIEEGSPSDAAEPKDTIAGLLSSLAYDPDVVYQQRDMGNVVGFIQTALTELGYYDGTISSSYGARTATAVAAFQTAEGLPATGACDAKTMMRLFRLYLGDVETTYGPGFENLHFTNDAHRFAPLGLEPDRSARLIDLWTDVAMNVKLTSLDAGHIDARPQTAADTRALCRLFAAPSAADVGHSLRPMLLVIGEAQIVCSMAVCPQDNDVRLCLHLRGSQMHGGEHGSMGAHGAMIAKADNLMERKKGRTVGVGSIVSGGSAFESMPPVQTPTLILPDGTTQSADALLKYDRPKHTNGTIVYNVHLSDLDGDEKPLLEESTLCFPYPEGLDQHSAKKYRIIIHHRISDKQTEVFKSEDGDIDFAPQGLCIRIKSFSPFEITWDESPALAGAALPADADLPETGDDSAPLALLALAAAASLLALFLRKKTSQAA